METVIGRVQAERQPEIEAIQALQIEAMTLPPAFRLPALRMTVLPVMRRLGIAKRIMLKTERSFRHGITEVRLRV